MRFTNLLLILGGINLLGMSVTSCKDGSEKATLEVLHKWIGEKLPDIDSLELGLINNLNINDSRKSAPYTILRYVDNPMCTSCDLRLPEYIYLINRISKITKTEVDFLCIVATDDLNELSNWLKRDCVEIPIYVDTTGCFLKKLEFETSPKYHTMLIDSCSRILAIGDPFINRNIQKLYIEILNKARVTGENCSMTHLVCSDVGKTNLNISLDKPLLTSYEIENVGEFPFVLDSIQSSCECIQARLSTRKILPHEKSILTVTINSMEKGFFYRTIEIMGNTDDNIILEFEGKAN